ncbi:MAG: tetratricopeptide repeat protein [Anaerolineae bacterium]|jgi:tetratricopeptide (TPR) repeat protein
MIAIDPYLLLLLVACLYALVFGGLGLLRREGLSIQFPLEVAALTALSVGGSWLLGSPLSPFVFLLILYIVTMRSRLVVDLANLLASRERYELAYRLYRLGLAWWPDATSRLIVLMNLGAAYLRSGQVDTAIETLQGVLEGDSRLQLGLKYEAACHYNLGYAYERKGNECQAVGEYNQAIDVMPGSVYAQAAEAALKRRKDRSA